MKQRRAQETGSSPDAAITPARGVPTGAPGPLMRIVKDQRILFLLVGGLNTAFSTGLFIGLALYFTDAPSSLLLTVSWATSLLAVFFVYRRLVFRVVGHLLRDFSRFVVVNLSSLVINIVLLFLVSDVLGFPGYRRRSRSPSSPLRSATSGTSTSRSGGRDASRAELLKEHAAMAEPLVSIVIPAYNNEQYIAETLRSALSQDYAHYEVVVADHSSIDATAEIIAGFAGDPRLRILTPTPEGEGRWPTGTG